MKKYIFCIFLLICSVVAFSQPVRSWQGFDPTTNLPGYIYRDTAIIVPYTPLQYLTGYKTFGSFPDSARAAITLTTTGSSGAATYNSATGVFNIPQYSGGSSLTLTTTGTGAATLISNVLNIPTPAGGGGSGWNLTGNSLLSRVTDFVGTTDTSHLLLKTKGIMAVQIDSSQNITIAKKVTFNITSGTTGNVGGQLSFGGPHVTKNALLIYDGGATIYRTGFGFDDATATSSIFARETDVGALMFGTGVDATTITPGNSNFFLQGNSAGTPAANGKITVFNGTAKFSGISATNYTFPTGINTGGMHQWGNGVDTYAGVQIYTGATSQYRSGFINKAADGSSVIYGRISTEFLFGNGFDQTNMTSSNASFFINTSNILTANAGLIVNGPTTTTQLRLSALNTAPANSTASGVTGEVRIVNGFIYVCVASDTWQRAPLTTF